MSEVAFSVVQTWFEHALQALAAPADVQLSLFPAFAHKVDELALDFDHWYRVYVTNPQSSVTHHQQALLSALDARLQILSIPQHAAMWTEESLRTRSEWADVRVLAAETLASFGWDVAIPPPSGGVYIPSNRDPADRLPD